MKGILPSVPQDDYFFLFSNCTFTPVLIAVKMRWLKALNIPNDTSWWHLCATACWLRIYNHVHSLILLVFQGWLLKEKVSTLVRRNVRCTVFQLVVWQELMMVIRWLTFKDVCGFCSSQSCVHEKRASTRMWCSLDTCSYLYNLLFCFC